MKPEGLDEARARLLGLLLERRIGIILGAWREHPEAPMFVHLNYRRESRSNQT